MVEERIAYGGKAIKSHCPYVPYGDSSLHHIGYDKAASLVWTVRSDGNYINRGRHLALRLDQMLKVRDLRVPILFFRERNIIS